MLMDADLSKAEKMLEDVESYVRSAAWHSGRNLQAVSQITSVDTILNKIEQAGPSSPILFYLEQLEKALALRRRWLRLKDELPPNPFGLPQVTWNWRLLVNTLRELEKPTEDRATARATAHDASDLVKEKREEVATTPGDQTDAPVSDILAAVKKLLQEAKEAV